MVSTLDSSIKSTRSSTNDHCGGGMTMKHSLQGTLVLTLFVVVIIQLHLSMDHFFSHSAPCPVSPLDGFYAPTVITKDDTVATKSSSTQRRTQEASLHVIPSPLEQKGIHQFGSKVLPEINHMGMIIFYLHIPKTGGTTIMQPFEKNKHWRYRMVYGWNKEDKYRQEMYQTLENWEPGMKIFYEYHAGLSSPFMALQVREDLLKWRAMAQVRKIPFFAFTVLREPLSFAISHFNFYYASRKKGDTRYFFVENPTEDDFLRLSLPNPQCLFCVHTEEAYYQSYREQGKPIHVPREGCKAVYDSFATELDWVGTMESLSNETFPIIEHVANVKFHRSTVRNKSHDKITRQNLKDSTIAYIRNITSFDLDMYQRAQADFPVTMWSNLVPHATRPPHNHTNLHMAQFDAPDLLGHEQRKREKERRLRQKRESQNAMLEAKKD